MAHAGTVTTDLGDRRPDVWLAVAAGPTPWLDVGVVGSADRFALAGGLAAGLGIGAAVSMAGASTLNFDPAWHSAVFVLGVLVTVGLILGPSLLLIDERHGLARSVLWGLWPSVLRRAGATVALFALTVRAYGSVQPIVVAAFSTAAGPDIAVTLRLLGIGVVDAHLVRRFLRSAVHLGAVAGAAVLTQLSPELRSLAVRLVVSLYLTAGATATVLFGVTRLRASLEHSIDQDLARTREQLHRDRAHWLHDDVCSEIRSLRLGLESGVVQPPEVVRHLDDLDHRLRLGQLEEIMQGGAAGLAEIVQPYIRVVQNRGLRLLDVPTFDTASITLPAPSGRLVQRALAVLVANAVQAGAQSLSIRTTLEDGELVVEVEDDAGGFDVSHRPLGRGLDGLDRDLGPNNLHLATTGTGTLARAVVAVNERGQRQ